MPVGTPKFDTNNRYALFAVSSSDYKTPIALVADPITGALLTSGGGTGGGGAVTVADAADITQGALADVAVVGDNGGSVSAKLRGINKALAGTLTIAGAVTLAALPALVAGSAIVGKFGLDISTPGTTNAMSLAYVGSTAVVNGGVAGTLAVGGVTAAAATATGNPVRIGAIGRLTNPTAVADGQVANLITDKLGKLVAVQSIRDLKGDAPLTISASIAETTLIAAVASTFIDVYGVIVTNTSATACEVVFRDVLAGTPRFSIECPAGDTRGFMLSESAAYKQATVNTAWTAQCSASVSSIKISALYVKNL
jgi:hypothetical protein